MVILKGRLLALLMLVVWVVPNYAAISVVDDVGASIVLNKPAKRIISLAPHLTEIIYAIGAGSQLIAVGSGSDYPKRVTKLPRVAGMHGLDIEKILSLHPDLVINWYSGEPPSQIAVLRQLGINVYQNKPRTIANIEKTMINLGLLTGHQQKATVLARHMHQAITTLKKRYAGAKPVRVFYQIWQKPFITIGHGHIIDQIITLCGGQNVFGKLNSLAPRVSLEAILKANPQVIIGGNHDPKWQRYWQAFPQIAAVKKRHLFVINDDDILRPGPRLIMGVKKMCRDLATAR